MQIPTNSVMIPLKLLTYTKAMRTPNDRLTIYRKLLLHILSLALTDDVENGKQLISIVHSHIQPSIFVF